MVVKRNPDINTMVSGSPGCYLCVHWEYPEHIYADEKKLLVKYEDFIKSLPEEDQKTFKVNDIQLAVGRAKCKKGMSSIIDLKERAEDRCYTQDNDVCVYFQTCVENE